MSEQYENDLNPQIAKDTIDKKDYYQIRQNSHYDHQGKAAPDNNLFWEERSNPLSSKGN